MENAPIIIGGNGHSGTRIFAEILERSGVSWGFPGITYSRNSKDLNVRGLISKWIRPYLLEQSEACSQKMRREFDLRLRLLFPFRHSPWGFKNPRSMFLLPFFHEMFPEMKFVHVIRDGRDICFGNPFVKSPALWSFVDEHEAQTLPPEQVMMRFWGESNIRVQEYGQSHLKENYLQMRFEDLCANPEPETARLLRWAGRSDQDLETLASLVATPKSIGRWKTYPEADVRAVINLGGEYLLRFGYSLE